MNDKEPWYMGERAQSLAILALTDHPEVSVLPQNEADAGPSIYVALREAGKPAGRLFGVDVRGMVSGGPGGTGNLSIDADSQLHYRDITFPVCLFLFTVNDGQGYWGWVQQPVFSAGKGPALKWSETLALKPLGPAELSGIIHAVAHWYDERSRYSVGQDVGARQLAGTPA